MAHQYTAITFTDEVKKVQMEQGSRLGYTRMEEGEDYNFLLSQQECNYIETRDSFYMASVSETGWPYVQHRGGPAGFVRVLDAKTIGFADFKGNRQYISTGNFRKNDRVSIIFMDYPSRTRLKLIGHVRIIVDDDWETLARLEVDDYRARVERGFIIQIEGFDWNCPQHITPRYTEEYIQQLIEPLEEENRALKAALGEAKKQNIDSKKNRYERFNAEVADNAKPVTIKLQRSELQVEVGSDQSLLDAMLDAGIAVPFSCKTGKCKSCAVKVLEGEAEHKDSVLSETEKTQHKLMCPCVSRAKSEHLTLDI